MKMTGISSTTDWCQNYSLCVDSFTALRRRWQRCSMIVTGRG